MPYDLQDIEDLLEHYGNKPLIPRKPRAGNGSGGGHKNVSPFIAKNPGAPVDVKAIFSALTYQGQDGTNINEAYKRAVPSRLMEGLTPDEVISEMVAECMAAAQRGGESWSQEKEVERATRSCASTLHYLQQKNDWSQSTPPWLPSEHLERWADIQSRGKRPLFVRNPDNKGWHVREYPIKDSNPEEPVTQQTQSTAEVIPLAPKREESATKRFKFPLLRFNEMKPGIEPNYLVDELIPVAGLVVIYGAPKGGKSFWALDLMMHVALGWEYRDRYVEQGAIIYAAFEGAHGYRKRCEAFRRHHQLTDETDPPLYIVPGRADLIRDHAALIGDIRAQLGDKLKRFPIILKHSPHASSNSRILEH